MKLDRILEKITALESGIYAGVNALAMEDERKAVCASGILGKVQQSRVLLEQILNSSEQLAVVSRTSIWSEHQDILTENPIMLNMEEDGTIKLQYVEGNIKENCLPYDTYKIYTTTISSMLPGDTMRDASDDEDFKWFAETNGIPVNKSETYARLGTDWATFLLQEGIGNLPVVGGVIDSSTAIIEQIGGSTDILDSAKTYEQMTNIAKQDKWLTIIN